MTYALTLLETVLPEPGATFALTDSLPRMIYVATGEASFTDRRFIRRIGADAAAFFEEPLETRAEAPNTTLWIWELARSTAPAELPDAGTVKLRRELDLLSATEVVMRLDRVDFPPGGVAYSHVHPGPGIRIVLHGEIGIRQHGRMAWMKAGQAWFERGPDPVYAPTTEGEATAFVRCLLLPPEWRGRNTIRYVNPADADKPKPQRYHRFIDALVPVPR